MPPRVLAGAGAVALALLASPAIAQEPAGHATLRVMVRHDDSAVADAMVRAAAAASQTDRRGEAVLALPAGEHHLIVSRLGLRPDTAVVTLRAGQDTTIVVALEEQAALVEEIIVAATRTERRIEDVPLRVEVLEREEVEEKMLMTPGDISMMLNETGGLRVQTTSPSLGAANVRVQGLAGRYTLMLADGLPLYGGQSGTLGLLQIPPMDLARVEVIKGVASALYGSSALGGVVNLVSRRPGEAPERELLLNQTTRGGSDAVLWSSAMFGDRWGHTLLVGAHRQPVVDVDDDGWTDLAGYRRVVARPRAIWTGDAGRNAMLTLGATAEEREGGTLQGRAAPDGAAFVEALDTRRFDAGGLLRLPFAAGLFSARSSGTVQLHEHRFGPVVERDRHDTWFGELALASARGAHSGAAGVALQLERYASREMSRFDYAHAIPAAFAQVDLAPSRWVSLTLSGRADVHSEYGAAFNPRVSVLLRAPRDWTARLSAGTGVFAPTPFTEETEATGLTPLRALAGLAEERARSASVDVGGKAGPFEVNATAFGSTIAQALIVRPAAGSATELELVNASLPTRTLGADALLRYRLADLTTTVTYTHVHSTEEADEAPVRRVAPLVPRHAAGLVSVWEVEGVQRVGLEVYYTGRQRLDDNPYLAESRPYVIYGAIAERRVGRARLFVNLENIGGARMTRYQPLVRPSRGEGGRWTTDAWGPTEGRTINGGVRWDFAGAGAAEP